MELIGRTLGKYQILEEMGRGGMGVVYKGYDPTLERYVAVKVLAPHLVWEQEFVQRFLREARAAAKLDHPNIVTICEGRQEGRLTERKRPYFFWDYDLTEGDIRTILHGDNEVEKAWVITRILEYARWEDIWTYLTPGDIRENLDHLRFRRPQDKELWAYALQRWGYG